MDRQDEHGRGLIITRCGVVNARFSRCAPWLLLTLLSLASISGCASTPERIAATPSSRIAIIGVASAVDLPVDTSAASLTHELTELVRMRDAVDVLPTTEIARTLGQRDVRQLLDRFAADGELSRPDKQRLMAAGLPAEHALVVGIVLDEIRTLEPYTEAVHETDGRIARDRYAIVQPVERETALVASLIELGSGRILWQRGFAMTPVSRTSLVRYHGSSLGGSVVATLANTLLAAGARPTAPQATAAPDLHTSLRRLLTDVARSLPLNTSPDSASGHGSRGSALSGRVAM